MGPLTGSFTVQGVHVGTYRGWWLWVSARPGVCAAAFQQGPLPAGESIIRRNVAELITAIDDESEPF